MGNTLTVPTPRPMRPTIRVYASTLLCASVLSVAAHRAAPSHTDRLEALARLDAAVHYFHPAVATGAIEWDSLFAARVVAIADAPTQAEYAHRVSELLARLGDGATRIVHPNRMWGFSLTADSVLVIAPSARPASTRDLATAAGRGSVVVVDLRGDADAPPDAMLAILVRGTIDAPAQRSLEYSGFPSPAGTGAQMYRIHWRATEGEHFQGASTAARRVAFLADGASVVPAGRARAAGKRRGCSRRHGCAACRPCRQDLSGFARRECARRHQDGRTDDGSSGH